MATGKITIKSVDALRDAKVAGFLWDTELKGFGVRIFASGAASYILQYRMGGREAKTQRVTIGTHGSPWSAHTARAEANHLLLLIGQGQDPIAVEQKRRRETVDLAFSPYAERFGDACVGDGWRTLVRRSLRLHVQPILGNKPLPIITRADVVSVFDKMPTEQAANRRNVFAVLRRLFRWAISRGDIDRSPMEGMDVPPAVRSRDRWLADEELGRIWRASYGCHRCFGPIVRLLICTGQRREEVTALDWSELKRDEKLWRLPGERTKNSEPNTVPLSDLAILLLDAVARGDTWPKRGRVFPTSTGAAFIAHGKGKMKLDKLIGEDGGDPLAPWRLHDLRRTLATGFQRLGVRFEVTEAVLNHVGASRRAWPASISGMIGGTRNARPSRLGLSISPGSSRPTARPKRVCARYVPKSRHDIKSEL